MVEVCFGPKEYMHCYLDKATFKRDGNATQNGGMVLVDGAQSSLHALIGVLIRHESEMNVDPSLSSIRYLQQ
uniref:Uncharacterized protein n=1 Tax=Parascaris equorum TaxID=6256 RepID=A0A914S7P5_PAREQ